MPNTNTNKEPIWTGAGHALFLNEGTYSLYERLPYIEDGGDVEYVLGKSPVREGAPEDITHNLGNIFTSDVAADLTRLVTTDPMLLLLLVGAARVIAQKPTLSSDNLRLQTSAAVVWTQLGTAIDLGVSIDGVLGVAKQLIQAGLSKSKAARPVLARLRDHVGPRAQDQGGTRPS